AEPRAPLLRQRALHERREIESVATAHAKRLVVVALLEQEPVGVDRLRTLVERSVEPNGSRAQMTSPAG
ncbi:partial Arsenical pump-driving ATPase, partial [Methylacidimicrobium cyclopophantes]